MDVLNFIQTENKCSLLSGMTLKNFRTFWNTCRLTRTFVWPAELSSFVHRLRACWYSSNTTLISTKLKSSCLMHFLKNFSPRWSLQHLCWPTRSLWKQNRVRFVTKDMDSKLQKYIHLKRMNQTSGAIFQRFTRQRSNSSNATQRTSFSRNQDDKIKVILNNNQTPAN